VVNGRADFQKICSGCQAINTPIWGSVFPVALTRQNRLALA